MDKKHCVGCRSDFYNNKNEIVVKECWLFKKAKLKWKIPIGMNEFPPYRNKQKQRVPDCYHESGPNKTLWVSPKALDKDGYLRTFV